MSPFVQNGAVIFPRYDTQFSHVTTPTDENGLLGGVLQATYTFSNPDSFYTRIVPLATHVGEVGQKLLSAGSNSTGPVISTTSGWRNYESGKVSFLSERAELTNNDRVARSFLSFYNRVIVSFEQVLETINGDLVGDRNGKFRFDVPKGKEISAPGDEDSITGLLTPRNLWRQVFAASNTANTFVIADGDPIVNPLTASLSSGVLSGNFPDATILDQLIRLQLNYIQNDIDDIVLVSPGQVELRYLFPLFVQAAKGVYKKMGESHQFSRIFPETARAFTTTYPGIGATSSDNGSYSFSKTIDPSGFSFEKGNTSPVSVSTHGKAIAKISNPVSGVLENISNISVSDRLPRARIWGYSKTGYPSLDFNTTGKPTILATPLRLRELPIDSDTGLPDTTKLVSEGGTLKDLVSGDYDLSVPGFSGYNDSYQLEFGSSDGNFFEVGYSGQIISVGSQNRMASLYVDEIYKGCLITLKSKDSSGNDISVTDPNQILRLNSDLISGSVLELDQGNTVILSPPSGEPVEIQDPPTQEDLQRLSQSQSSYRVGFDVGLRGREGELVDLSLPSFSDPSFLGIKEIFGQNTPSPVSHLEAQVKYLNNQENPLNIPALQGQSKDDYGDYTLPYLSASNTELDRFSGIENGMKSLLETKSVDNTLYVYPNEILSEDGEIFSSLSGSLPPSTLITDQDVTPVANGSSASGIGDLQPYDLLLVEADNSEARIRLGSQGILSVGAVAWDDQKHGQAGSVAIGPMPHQGDILVSQGSSCSF